MTVIYFYYMETQVSERDAFFVDMVIHGINFWTIPCKKEKISSLDFPFVYPSNSECSQSFSYEIYFIDRFFFISFYSNILYIKCLNCIDFLELYIHHDP